MIMNMHDFVIMDTSSICIIQTLYNKARQLYNKAKPFFI